MGCNVVVRAAEARDIPEIRRVEAEANSLFRGLGMHAVAEREGQSAPSLLSYIEMGQLFVASIAEPPEAVEAKIQCVDKCPQPEVTGSQHSKIAQCGSTCSGTFTCPQHGIARSRTITCLHSENNCSQTVTCPQQLPSPPSTPNPHSSSEDEGEGASRCQIGSSAIAAFIQFSTFSNAPTKHSTLFIKQVSVAPQFSGQRIGSQLLDFAECWGRDMECTALDLTTYRDVHWNRAYYQKLGFKVLGDEELKALDATDLRRRLVGEQAAGREQGESWQRVGMRRAVSCERRSPQYEALTSFDSDYEEELSELEPLESLGDEELTV